MEGSRAILDPKLDIEDGLPDHDIRSLLFGSGGIRWAATSGGLVGWSSPKHLRVFTAKHGLSDDSIYALAEDPTGDLWTGTRRGGIIGIARQDWKTFDQLDGLAFSQDEMILETRAGEVCVVRVSDPRRSVECLDRNRFTTFLPAPPRAVHSETPNSLQMMLQDHLGSWWIATNHGVLRVRGAASARQLPRSRYIQMIAGIQGNRFFEDSVGDVWIAVASYATGNRLLKWRRDADSITDESQIAPAESLYEGVSAFAEIPPGQL